MSDWPPLTARQRRTRRLCAFWAFVGLTNMVWGSTFLVGGDPAHQAVGAAQVVVGAGSLGAGIFCWPTRYRNRLRDIDREASH